MHLALNSKSTKRRYSAHTIGLRKLRGPKREHEETRKLPIRVCDLGVTKTCLGCRISPRDRTGAVLLVSRKSTKKKLIYANA